MSKSPFYKSGISKSPLFEAGEYADTKRKQAVRKGQKRLTGEEAEEAMSPVQMNQSGISKKRRARRGERVQRLEKKLGSLHEQVPIEGVDEFDLPSTPKSGVSERKINRINKRIERISDKTTEMLRKKKSKKEPTDYNLSGKSGYFLNKKDLKS